MSEFLSALLGNRMVSRQGGEGYDSRILPGALTATLVAPAIVMVLVAWIL